MKRFNIAVNGVHYDVVVDEVPINGSVQPIIPQPSVAPAQASISPAAVPVSEIAVEADKKISLSTDIPSDAVKVVCPMPGTVINIFTSVGESVKKGTKLLTFEAMKMENEIQAPQDSVVSGIFVDKGDTVETNQLLLTLKV